MFTDKNAHQCYCVVMLNPIILKAEYANDLLFFGFSGHKDFLIVSL